MNEKKQAIIIVSLILTFTAGIFIYHIHSLESRISTLMIEADARELHLTVQNLQKYSYATYRARIKNLLFSDPAIISNFAKRDRAGLYTQTKIKYDALQKENPFFHVMQFHLPDGSVFLRIQQPDLFGPPANGIRPMIKAAHQSQTAQSGFEFGPEGFCFRVVQPVFSDGMYVGALELGILAQQMVQAIEDNMDERVVSYFLSDDAAPKAVLLQGQPSAHDENRATEEKTTPLIQLLPPDFFKAEHDQVIRHEGKIFSIHDHHIFNNFKNENLGGIIFFQDISAPLQRKKLFICMGTLITVVILLIVATVLYISFGKILASLVKEVANRKQAEQDILDREAQIRLLLDSTAEGIFGLDHEGRCTFVNQSCLKLLGYTHEDELLGHILHDLIHHHRPDGSDFPSAECPMCESFKHGQAINVDDEVLWRKDGQPVPVVYHAYPINQDNLLLGAVVSFSDISRRKQAEEDKERLAAAIEHAADEIIITNLNGEIEYVNPAFEKVSGYSRQEALGQNPKILKSGQHPETFYQDLWRTVRAGMVWSNRITNRTKSGTLIQEDATISPIFSRVGKPIGYVAVKRDVTHKIKMEERLQQASKMECLGTLAGTIAHDFNNILNGINGFTSLAIRDVPPTGTVAKHLNGVMQASSTATELIQQILAFTRKTDSAFKPLRVQDTIQEVVTLLRCTIPKSIEIDTQIDMECEPVFGNPTQIHQVLMNLGTNAYHAMREQGGILTIKLAKGDMKNGGRSLRLQVIDTGDGIPLDVLEHMFEPYFTTKKEGEGTGLGLSTVHEIVEHHHGDIRVESELGVGTTFTLHFPVTTQDGVRYIANIPLVTPEATGHVLFVDDAVINVILGQEILQGAGYTVTGLSDPVEALELFRQHPQQFDLIVTDQIMPNMTGTQMAREMIQIRPDIPIIMVSGDEYSEDDPELIHSGIRGNLPKPFEVTTLLAAAARELQPKPLPPARRE